MLANAPHSKEEKEKISLSLKKKQEGKNKNFNENVRVYCTNQVISKKKEFNKSLRL